MSVDTVLRPDIVNYKTMPMHNGRYRLRRLALNNLTSSTVAISSTSTTLVEWKITANTVFNPARSVIDYQLVLAALAANYNWSFEDTMEICNSIQFGNASGTLLTDLNYASNYVNIARKIDTPQVAFEGSDYTSGLYKSATSDTNFFPPSANLPANNAYGIAAAVLPSAISQVEPQYARVSPINTAQQLTRSIPLSAFTHTALGMDRDMIFGEDMYIRMQISPSSKIGYVGTSAANPSHASAAVFTTQPVLTNLHLHLAVQVDPVVAAHVHEKFMAGNMSFIFPYVYGWRQPSVGATVASIQLQINSQFGRYLKRLIYAPFDATEALNKAYDHQNMDGAKISSYQTSLDSQPLQDYVMSCKQPVVGGAHGMDDWRENRIHCKGSALENSAAYYYNWFHCDSFSQPKRDVLVPEDNILEGLDLSMPRSWTFTGTTTASLTHYTWGTFVREVIALPGSPTIVKV